MEYESTIEASEKPPETTESPPEIGAVGFEHRRLKESVRQDLFGHAHESGHIGRFEVRRRLGAGGMGVVYAAFDDELDREVAIKLLRTDRRGEGAESRLRREAQAIAKLSHPNVVGVFEVGRHAGSLFVAMEFVNGQTLRQWLETPRQPAEIVDVYLQAAAGLAAAHAAGLVHRDFKPDNVMLGDDGRVRVLDFGLAAAVGESTAPEESSADHNRHADPKLTDTGTVLGTPNYMAPEQCVGRPADARSDQFSWCVSLWEALCGERPFLTEGTVAFLDNVTSGPSESAGTALPPPVRRVLLRGLHRDPQRRWSSMDELAGELRRARHRRRRIAVAVAGCLALAAAGGLASVGRGDDCPDPEDKLAEVWSPPRIAKAREAVAASGAGVSLARWQEIETDLDAFAATWSAALTANCDADVSDAERLETRLCLERLVGEVRLVTDELVQGRVEFPTPRAPDPTSCADTEKRRAQAREASQRTSPAPPGSEGGLVSDFEVSMQTAFGAGWAVSTDGIIGGDSAAKSTREPRGAGGSNYAMKVAGTVEPGAPSLWSGAMFFVGDSPMAPANLASKRTVSFGARGKPGRYIAMFFTVRNGFQPLLLEFDVTENWRTVTLGTADFGGELYDATGFFIGSGEVGSFELWIDDLRMD